jgi:hypothetical protein
MPGKIVLTGVAALTDDIEVEALAEDGKPTNIDTRSMNNEIVMVSLRSIKISPVEKLTG